MSGGRVPTPRCGVCGPLRERGTSPIRGTVCHDQAEPNPAELATSFQRNRNRYSEQNPFFPAEATVIPPPPAPMVMTPGTAMGHAVVQVGRDTTSLGVWIDDRFVRRIPIVARPRDGGAAPVGLHSVRVRATGPQGSGGRRNTLWVLPASARLPKVSEGERRGCKATSSVDRTVAGDQRRVRPAPGDRCGAAVNARARFPAASTLKAAILLDVERRSGGRPSAR